MEVKPGFCFRDCSLPEPAEDAEVDHHHVDGEVPFSGGVLEVYVHHARNIHNICIYDDQDVYAKFSLTHRPDEAISTRVARGGGRNPDFHELLRVLLPPRRDPVLKCEIWMLSRAPHFLDDQLLGFALVPLSSLAAGDGKGTPPQDFTLSSTDLFHIPAGTVRLTLSLTTPVPIDPTDAAFAPSSSIASEVVLLDPVEYVAGDSPGDAGEKPEHGFPVLRRRGGARLFLANGSHEAAATRSSETPPASPTSKAAAGAEGSGRDPRVLKSEKAEVAENSTGAGAGAAAEEMGSLLFKSPQGSIEEQSAMQRQVVDMYMRSVQQFTDSLARMELPMDIDGPKEEGADVVQIRSGDVGEERKRRKDGSRVFYGSRAFF